MKNLTRRILANYIIKLFVISLICAPVFVGNLKATETESKMVPAQRDAGATLSNPKTWLSDKNITHPLVGKIWSTRKARFVTASELTSELKQKQYILLGEIHDNPDHHWLQAEIIKSVAAGAEKPALVMEMIKLDQMQRLNAYRSQKNAKAEHLGTALQWSRQGWPDWKIYLPIGKQIFAHDLEVFPGHTTRMMINHLIKSDLGILPDEAKKTFKLDQPLSPELNKALEQDIRIGHCNKLPEHVIPSMAAVQRFRDAWMADVMLQAREVEARDIEIREVETKKVKTKKPASTTTTEKKRSVKKRPVILIAGSGHTRNDRGVPWYLNKRIKQDSHSTTNHATSSKPKASPIISIEFLEASGSAKTIKALATKSPKGQFTADYIWVTPSVKRQDPCSKIPDFGKKQAPKMHKQQ